MKVNKFGVVLTLIIFSQYCTCLGVLAEELPQPKIEQPILIDHDVVMLGDWVTVIVRAKNYGCRADEMYISVSLPENPPLENIEIIDSDLQATYVLGPGDKVWGDYGQTYPITLQYPLVEGYTWGWENGQTKYLKFKFKPHKIGTFKLYVKTTAQTGGIWRYDPVNGTKDQQNEYVYMYAVTVLEESVIFFDDFESYEVGTFPSGGGWRLTYDGAGVEYQVVTSYLAFSGSKSFQLVGQAWWSACADKDFSSDAEVIGFEAYIMVDSFGSTPNAGDKTTAAIHFVNPHLDPWGRNYALIRFVSDGKIYAITATGWSYLQEFSLHVWYKVRVAVNKAKDEFNVWINNQLRATNLKIEKGHATEITALRLASGHAGAAVYFDDVKVFVGSAWRLAVIVYDWDGVGAALKGGDTWVELIRHGEVSGVTRHIDDYSRAVFYDVEPGTYYVNVWHKPLESGGLMEFWAQKTNIVVEEGKATTVEVKRHYPVITGFEVQQVPAKTGEPATITVKIKNIDSVDQWVKTRLIVKHESGEWVYQNESQSRKLQPEQETTFTFNDFKPEKEGAYYGLAICAIVGGGSQTTDQEGWKYLFSVGLSPTIQLNFSVYYEGKLYKVSLEVPYSRFYETVSRVDSNCYSWYPKIDPSILKQAYYLECHVRNPNGYPIFKLVVYQDDQQLFDENLKAKILSGLLNYCFELFGAAHPAKLNTYLAYSETWYKVYQQIAPWVQLSNYVSKILDWATLIGPIIESIKELYGATTSEQVKTAVSLYFDILSGYETLKEKYGSEKADVITDILIQYNLCSSKDYNPLELYSEFEASPSITLEVLEAISSEAFNLELSSDAKTLVKNFLEELKESTVGEFAAGAALSLYAYFGSGLTVKTAIGIGLTSAFEGFIKSVIPLALSRAIMKSYILPMADAINSAWESTGHIANSFTKMYIYGLRIANPENNIFNITESRIFASQLGLEYLSEYNYYVKTYFYRSRQIFKTQSELDYYKAMAQIAYSYAQKWANTISNIQNMATAIVQASDPEGETFDFELLPPPEANPYPAIPENARGFIVQINAATNITLKSGEYVLIVQDGQWYSNFTYPLYIDDAYGTQYLIIFNPQNQSYTVQTSIETTIKLENFEISNGNITTSTAGKIIGTTAEFKVSDSQIDPTTVIPEHQQNLILCLFILTMLIITIKRKKKINKQPQLLNANGRTS